MAATAEFSTVTTGKSICAQIGYSVAVPASKSLRGTASAIDYHHSIPPQSLKQCLDDAEKISSSSASYATALDNGMKSSGYQGSLGSDKKHSQKVVHKELQKEELGSLKKSCRTNKGHETVVGSSDYLGKLEEPVKEVALEDPVLGLVLNESPDGSESCIDFAIGPCKEFYEQQKAPFASYPSIEPYQSPDDSLCNGTVYTEAKESFSTTKVGDSANNIDKAGGSGKVSNSCDLAECRKTSTCRGSTGSDASDESSLSSFSNAFNKPHQANDTRWDAIQAVRSRDGVLGINHFKLLKRLGCGDIGSVYLSELNGTNAHFAMKVMDKATLASRKKLPRAQTEREILQSLDHPFLPTLYTHFETDKFSCLVMEFCPGGDLHALRQRQPNKHFPEHAARFYVAEVLLALEYLHMLGIIYRDLKPENVLVRDDGHIMLSDFDLSLRCAVSPTLVKSSNTDMDSSKRSSSYCAQPACIEPPSCLQPSCFGPRFPSMRSKNKKKIKPGSEIFNHTRTLPELIAEPTSARSMSFVGTHEYLAPEIVKGDGHGSAVDWWTFGIFLYELLYGKTPFKGSQNRATLFNVIGQPLRFPESPTVSFAARDLIRGLLVKEPQHRLAYRRGATEIKQHPFFQSVNWALIRCTNPPEVPKPFITKVSATTEMPTAPKTENGPGVEVKPSGNYLEIDFF